MDNSSGYTVVQLITVDQKDRQFYVGKMSFRDFEGRYTTSPAQYRMLSYENAGVEDERLSDLTKEIEKFMEGHKRQVALNGFQRGVDESRAEEIRKYLLTNEFGIIPNAIIVNVNAIEVQSQQDLDEALKEGEKNKAILFAERLYLPEAGTPFLIIDGQHRVEGCKRLPLEAKDKISLLFTFLVNADPSEQAHLFTTINYKVKPVSKSYLYQILAEFDIDASEYTFLHELVKLLNEIPRSPLFDRVKMLGRKSSAMNSLSQAFLVESFFLLLCAKKMPAQHSNATDSLIKLPVLRLHYLHDRLKDIAKILLTYLLAVRRTFETNKVNWNDINQNIILKTVGMGGVIDLFPTVYIHLIIHKNILHNQLEAADILTESDFMEILRPIAEIDVVPSEENPFSKGSSRGLVTKFAKSMWSKIAPTSRANVSQVNEYLDWFNKEIIGKTAARKE